MTIFNDISRIIRLEIRQLRYFVAVVDSRSLTRAAAALHIAQPALSQQMAQLEDILGIKLLIRSRLGVQPTQAGHAVYRHARTILKLVGETREIAVGGGETVSGRVRLALPSSLAMMLASPLLRAVRARHADIKLEIYESPSGYLASLLLDERVDMSILAESPVPGGAWLTPLVEEQLFFVAARLTSDGPPGDCISLADVADIPLVLTTRATTLRHILDKEFERAGVVPKVHAEVSSISTMLLLVEDGLGGTIVPGSALARASQKNPLQVRRIEPSIGRTATLAVSQTSSSAASKAVESILVETVADLVNSHRWMGASIPQ